jgi:hypothetical protein
VIDRHRSASRGGRFRVPRVRRLGGDHQRSASRGGRFRLPHRVLAALIAIVASSGPAAADTLIGLVPGVGDDARTAIAIGPSGEVYEPAKGQWVRTRPIATASRLAVVGRAGASVVAQGEGVVYRLASSGWSALRLAQSGKATLSAGTGAVAAVGRDVYSLERLRAGEPEKLALAPAPIVALGAGKTIVVATAKGVLRVDRAGKATKLSAPAGARLIGDRWAVTPANATDLGSGKQTPWPAKAAIGAASLVGGDLAVVARVGGALELWTLGTALARISIEPDSVARATSQTVGVVVDRKGRAVIALADGTLLVRDAGAWTTTEVTEALPAARPGPPPARQP